MIPINSRVKIYAPNYPVKISETWQGHLVKIGKNHGEKGVVRAHDFLWSHLVDLDNGQRLWVWERELKIMNKEKE